MSQVQVIQRQLAQSRFEIVVEFGRMMWQRFSNYRQARKTYAILSQMDDHQLADIGLNRTMIMNVSELLERGRR
jgi:uncharacterized protein YjiS (DUF1127 family)